MTLDWPEEDTKIEGKTRVRLEDDYGLRLSEPASAPSQAPAAKSPAESPPGAIQPVEP
jgi:hypothetical protein